METVARRAVTDDTRTTTYNEQNIDSNSGLHSRAEAAVSQQIFDNSESGDIEECLECVDRRTELFDGVGGGR